MLGRLLKFGVVAAVLALVLTAFAAQSPEIMAERAKQKAQLAPRRGGTVENRFNLPVADGRRDLREVRSSSRSVSILDDARKRTATDLRASAVASPGIAVCAAGTSYDYQHNDEGQKQIATIGGNPNTANVHFTWMHWDVIPESIDRVDRFVNYNGFNPGTGLCLGDCGVTVSGGGADPLLARGGYVTMDLMSDDNASLFFHQENAVQQPPGPQIYGTWVLDQGIPCFNLFAEVELDGSVANEIIWPHGRVDRNGSSATDVWHVCSHPTGDHGLGDEMVYWRRVGVAGTWQGPVVLDKNSGSLSYEFAVDPTSAKVAIAYNQDHLEPENLQQVVYMESATNGADWIASGVGIYPLPLTGAGFSFVQVSNYTDPAGSQAWGECGAEYDFSGVLHVYWVEQAFTNVAGDARLKHWSGATGFSTVAQAIGWNNQAGDGARDIVLAFPGLGFGDGTTLCTDGPDNPGPAGTKSNKNYVYYLWEQYGGESAVEQADFAPSSNQMNLDDYLSTSNDGGATWSPPTNLTNTKTPGCDGTPGNQCASEREPFIAYTVNNAIHVLYILDTEAGDAVFANGSWTFNPVMYYRIPGGTDADIVCPVIAPSFQAQVTNATPDCEFHTTYSPAGLVSENLLIENFGNASMNGNISGFTSDWLNVVGGAYVCAPAGSVLRAVTMDASATSIQTGGEGLYQDVINITHNDPSRPSPRVIPVDFFVFNDFACPDYVTLHTGDNGAKGAAANNGTLWLEVSNVERITREKDNVGLARLGSDSSWSVYDGSLIIGVPPDTDTLVYRNIFGTGNGMPGFRALSALDIDTTAYGTNAGAATAFANQTTVDSLVGIDVEYVFPQAADSAEFVLIKYKIFNRTGGNLLDLIVGEAVDFDINPRPDSLDNLQSTLQNSGHLVAGYNLVYQQGVDSTGHVVVGDVSAERFKGGMTSIQCGPAPRAWIAPNAAWLPGGFGEGYLYSEMTKTGFELFPPDDPNPGEDLHSVMIFEQNVDLTPTSVKHYLLGLVSSNTGLDDANLMATTKKAWKYAFGWQEFVSADLIHENTPASYPYFAVGSHEDGLTGGCCGCVVTELSDPQNKFSIGGGSPGDCEGTIEFAGGAACGAPYTATYKLQDLCAEYTDLYVITVNTIEGCGCVCDFQGDYDYDGFLTALDLGALIDVLFAGKPEEQDPACPTTRGDLDCDDFPTALDLGILIDYLFAGGPAPCDPCAK